MPYHTCSHSRNGGLGEHFMSIKNEQSLLTEKQINIKCLQRGRRKNDDRNLDVQL